jgi:hypothetical protein
MLMGLRSGAGAPGASQARTLLYVRDAVARQPTPRFECRLLLGRGGRFEDDCCLQ